MRLGVQSQARKAHSILVDVLPRRGRPRPGGVPLSRDPAREVTERSVRLSRVRRAHAAAKKSLQSDCLTGAAGRIRLEFPLEGRVYNQHDATRNVQGR